MRILVTVFLLFVAVSSSQGAYITDKLVAGLYKEAKVTNKPIKALNSGTPLEVVSRKEGFVQVRTSDGVIGWVESTYLTDEKPARIILLDTQARLSMMQKKLDKLSQLEEGSDVAKAAEEISALEEKLAQAQGKISQLELQLKAAHLSGDKLDQNRELLEREKQQLVADMQAKHAEAMKALQKQKESLQQQITQVAEILKLPSKTSSEAAQPKESSTSDSLQTASSVSAEFSGILSGKVYWVIALLILILGFAVGYYVMRYRVQQRFGSMFRL